MIDKTKKAETAETTSATTESQPASEPTNTPATEPAGTSATFIVPFLVAPASEPEDKTGHTYVHFGGALKARLVKLAKVAGYTRKLNTFGVMLIEQAITAAEADVKRQLDAAKAKADKAQS